MKSDTLRFELENINLFARLCSYLTIAWVATLLVAIIIGAFLVGHFPVYGLDNDPDSTRSALLTGLQVTHLLLSVVAIIAVPAWVFLIAHLLFISKASIRTNYRLWMITFVAIGLYFLVRQTSAFQWFMD